MAYWRGALEYELEKFGNIDTDEIYILQTNGVKVYVVTACD